MPTVPAGGPHQGGLQCALLHPLRRFWPRLRRMRGRLRTLRGGPRDGGPPRNEFPALASTPRDEPPATPSPAASNAPAPTLAVGPIESTVPSPSESTETTSPELDATTSQPTPATAVATGEDSNAPAAMLSKAPATTFLNNAKTSVPLPSSSRSEEAQVQLESPTAPEFQSSPSLKCSDLTEGSDEERLVINETARDAATGVATRSRTRYRERRRNASLEPRRLRSRSRSRHGGAEEGKRVLSSSDKFATPQGIPPAAARLKRLRNDFSSLTGSPSSQPSSETPSDKRRAGDSFSSSSHGYGSSP
ncbi:hypothetical protein HPB47_010702 [Ixodes persulcatus]|uniref:Uncharacterized protein n=1 Tax=Ixodes persulcatus TaxID=34615 RepID=A0AC60NYB6_IXOPE|nr:hypothetical protein HPB47_010702 [Ixodes persulcatus]